MTDVIVDKNVDQSYLYQIRVRRYLAAVISLCITGLMVAVPLRTYYDTWQENRLLAQNNIQLKDRINDLERQKIVHNDPAWVQAQARGRLQMVFPGEKAYRLEKDPGKQIDDSGKEYQRHKQRPWYYDIWQSISVLQ